MHTKKEKSLEEQLADAKKKYQRQVAEIKILHVVRNESADKIFALYKKQNPAMQSKMFIAAKADMQLKLARLILGNALSVNVRVRESQYLSMDTFKALSTHYNLVFKLPTKDSEFDIRYTHRVDLKERPSNDRVLAMAQTLFNNVKMVNVESKW